MKKKTIEITKEDLYLILEEDRVFFEEKIIPNCYCGRCKSPYNSTITNYIVYINDLDDIILRGSCLKCGHPIGRYLETGEVVKYQEGIKKVKKTDIPPDLKNEK